MCPLARQGHGDGERRLDLATDYVLQLFADAMNMDVAELQELDLNDPLDLTSVQNMTIVAQMDASIGEIPLTLLFDRPSPAAVVDYLVSERSSDLDRLTVRGNRPAADERLGSDMAYAYIYNKYFTSLVNSARVPIAAYFKRRGEGLPAVLLDLCCGTGQLACYFGRHGYRVFALDNSPGMLAVAQQNAAQLGGSHDIHFLRADATSFDLPEKASFVTATSNALCSIPDLVSLRECFAQVRKNIRDGGMFVFDMNTIAGLQQTNMVIVRESADDFFVIRTIYDPSTIRVIARTSGFLRYDDGTGAGPWQRFDNTAIESGYRVDDILAALSEAGWASARPAGLANLEQPLEAPEAAERCFFVAEATATG